MTGHCSRRPGRNPDLLKCAARFTRQPGSYGAVSLSTAHLDGKGGSLPRNSRASRTPLTPRFHIAKRADALRTLLTLRLERTTGSGCFSTYCGVAVANHQRRRRRFPMLRFCGLLADGRKLTIAARFPSGWPLTAWPAAGLRSSPFPSLHSSTGNSPWPDCAFRQRPGPAIPVAAPCPGRSASCAGRRGHPRPKRQEAQNDKGGPLSRRWLFHSFTLSGVGLPCWGPAPLSEFRDQGQPLPTTAAGEPANDKPQICTRAGPFPMTGGGPACCLSEEAT